MHKTKNDLPESVRTKSISLLAPSLAECLDLQTQAKQAHWNVKGPHFMQLHELFDKVSADLLEYVDELAERIVQLGGTAEGTVRVAAAKSGLPEYPLSITDGKSHVEALSNAVAAFSKRIRSGIDVAGQAGDADTADLFTEISRGLDKWIWFLEAHLQS